MPRPTKEQALALRAKWLAPLTTYFEQLAGPSHLAYLKSTALFRCITAANQSGKTTAMQADCVAHLLGKHPFQPNFTPERILVIITRTDQAAVIWGKRLLTCCELPGTYEGKPLGKLPWIHKKYVKKINWKPAQKFGKYPGSFEMANGSEYYMALAGDPDSWLGLEGLKFTRIYRDEATGNESLSDELEPRLWAARDDAINMPGAGGMDWGATETKDNEEYRKFKDACQKGAPNHAWFYFKTEENTSISQTTRESAKNRMSAEAYQVRALGLGSTTDRVKIIAPYWNREIHERNDVYRIRPDDNLRITFDPGWRDKGGVMCTVVSRDAPRELKIVRWRSYKFGGYSAFVMDMKAWLDGRTATSIVCDSQIHSSKQDTGETYYQVFCDLLKTHKVKTWSEPTWLKPRLEDSIPIVQHALQNHGRDHDPYRNSVVVYTGDSVATRTEEFIGDLLNSRWAVDREGNVRKQMVQRALEPFDCLRYELCHAPQWLDYGQEHGVTEQVPAPDTQEEIDPDLALHRARMAAGTRELEDAESSFAGDISTAFVL